MPFEQNILTNKSWAKEPWLKSLMPIHILSVSHGGTDDLIELPDQLEWNVCNPKKKEWNVCMLVFKHLYAYCTVWANGICLIVCLSLWSEAEVLVCFLALSYCSAVVHGSSIIFALVSLCFVAVTFATCEFYFGACLWAIFSVVSSWLLERRLNIKRCKKKICAMIRADHTLESSNQKPSK